MNQVNLVIIWHMHQPQYRDPVTGQYVLPWTRLHALKDYWGMVKVLEEYPTVHATFNFVPLLAEQIEEYARGQFKEPWFEIAFAAAESLTPEQKREALERAFQVNERLVSRWPRFAELQSQVRSGGAEACVAYFSPREWRDLQVLSQLAWMDEEYLEKDVAIRALSDKGSGFTEEDKRVLLAKQRELLAAVLPEYRRAAARGQIEISTTPYYHPILPLLCDTEIARVSSPHTPLPHPPFQRPEDAREQLVRARKFHEWVFGIPPAGLWPSEGSVSNQSLEIAMDLGFKWFATDEGVLGRTQNIGFWRDAAGYPENGPDLYTPWLLTRGDKQISGFFRDHYLSDLVGFVYSRMAAEAAAEDLHRRIRAVGDREPSGRTATVSVILDGENAWEYYPGNGRDFLRRFYRRLAQDPGIRALTANEAMEAVRDQPRLQGIFPASWINANFDVWIGHAEDVRAWDLLRDAREAYERAVERHNSGASSEDADWLQRKKRSYESLLAAEGSDWTWWYGPEHGSANDAEFDALYRKHLTAVYHAIGDQAPDVLAHPVKRAQERARRDAPMAYLAVKVDGRESNYFEWLGAGLYAADRRTSAIHGRAYVLDDLHYGFGRDHFYLRVDPIPEVIADMPSFQLRLSIWDSRETRISLRIENGKLEGCILEQGGVCLLYPQTVVSTAYAKILEVSLARELFDLRGRRELLLSVALWKGGLPLDVLPVEGMLDVALGEENFAWPPG
ncbi:MAG TPA: glycoside hydrolase family 57 protein [Candidatus Acidoferrales bacterium]|nr:glycoside hydrolase family 57 protein [Candidatus Acidoferrales bacterium]